MITRLESLFRQHAKLNALFRMDANFEGWGLDTAREAWRVKLAGRLMKGEISGFSSPQIEEAWD